MPITGSCPILVGGDDTSVSLERVALSGPESTALYTERWLQNLLYRHPNALPVEEIDNSYSGLIPVCTELPVGAAGYIDVLYSTASGRIAVLEAKLWRNPEARRKVIGQILDYAKTLSQWSYSTLDAQVQAARRREGKKDSAATLFGAVNAANPGSDERQFVDSVFRNLKRGEFLLLIAGDGIHGGVGEITDFLEGHGTLHFTFGLVELCIYKVPNGGLLIQPRVLAQSEIVRRVVVDIRGEKVSVTDNEVGNGDHEDDPELAKTREKFETFWGEFLSGLKLDDASQTIGKPSRSQNQYFNLPTGSKGWISAYIAQSTNEFGVYLTFERGPIADRMYRGLVADREAIEKELSVPVEWEAKDGKYFIIARYPCSGTILTDLRSDAKAWLADRVNRFITVFRPRIAALLQDI
jgi:hypothetical protein